MGIIPAYFLLLLGQANLIRSLPSAGGRISGPRKMANVFFVRRSIAFCSSQNNMFLIFRPRAPVGPLRNRWHEAKKTPQNFSPAWAPDWPVGFMYIVARFDSRNAVNPRDCFIWKHKAMSPGMPKCRIRQPHKVFFFLVSAFPGENWFFIWEHKAI